MQNGYIQSFNGRMRDELLNESLFFGLDHARELIAAYAAGLRTARDHHAAQRTGSARWPLGSCRATRRITCRGSNSGWMKLQWQVTVIPT